jgi:GTP cyclohydrolase II
LKISEIANLPTKYGKFKIQSFKENDKEHLVIFTENLPEIPLVRIHSECLTGDALGSLKCDCGEQLEYALKKVNKEGGMVIYLRQEGMGIGLFNKVNAYALQDKGLDTVEANHQLGFEADMRDFSIVEKILKHFNINKIKLLTNNPRKEFAFKDIVVTERIPIIMKPNPYNINYLKTKKEKLGHKIEFDNMENENEQ